MHMQRSHTGTIGMQFQRWRKDAMHDPRSSFPAYITHLDPIGSAHASGLQVWAAL